MDPLQLGAQLLGDKLGLKLEPSTVQSALSSLMGDGKGGIDLQGLVSQFSASGEENGELVVGHRRVVWERSHGRRGGASAEMRWQGSRLGASSCPWGNFGQMCK